MAANFTPEIPAATPINSGLVEQINIQAAPTLGDKLSNISEYLSEIGDQARTLGHNVVDYVAAKPRRALAIGMATLSATGAAYPSETAASGLPVDSANAEATLISTNPTKTPSLFTSNFLATSSRSFNSTTPTSPDNLPHAKVHTKAYQKLTAQLFRKCPDDLLVAPGAGKNLRHNSRIGKLTVKQGQDFDQFIMERKKNVKLCTAIGTTPAPESMATEINFDKDGTITVPHGQFFYLEAYLKVPKAHKKH